MTKTTSEMTISRNLRSDTTQIRPLSAEDTSQVLRLAIAAWEPVFSSFRTVLGPDLFARYYPDWRSEQEASVRDALESNDTWVAADEDVVQGFVNVTFDKDELIGDIYMIAVDPAYQRRGIATLLARHALGEMVERGMTLATVSTGGDPGHAPARQTYESLGFTPFPQVIYSLIIDQD